MQLILTVTVIHLMACLSPGPDIFLVVLNSLRHGWRTGMATTTGILTGVSLQITLGIAGISYLVSRHPGLQTGLALAGGIWLVYLGGRGLLPDHDSPAHTGQPARGEVSDFVSAWNQGFLVNILNPKALLYFVSIFSGLLGAQVDLGTRISCGVAMLGIQALAFGTVALLISRPACKDRWLRLQGWLDRGISVVLLVIGIWIILHGLLSLMD